MLATARSTRHVLSLIYKVLLCLFTHSFTLQFGFKLSAVDDSGVHRRLSNPFVIRGVDLNFSYVLHVAFSATPA